MTNEVRVACAAMLCPSCAMHVTFTQGPQPPHFQVVAECENCHLRWTWELPKQRVTPLPWTPPATSVH